MSPPASLGKTALLRGKTEEGYEGGGGAAAGTPDHGDSGEAAGSIEGNEGDRFPSSPWARVARGSAPTAAAIHHEVAHGGTVGVGARWCGARAVPADAGERR
jgi:hypothetical protein